MKDFVKQLRYKKGFTLIESVIAISIIGVIGIIMMDILGRTFDNNEKTNLVSNVQQNGQAALNTIDDVIRNSQFVCLGGKNTSGDVISPNQVHPVEYQNPILTVFRDGRYIRYQIIAQTTSNNGYILEDYPTTSVQDLNSAFCKSDVTPPFVPATYATGMRKISNDTALSVKRAGITLLSNPVTGYSGRGTSNVAITIMFSIGPSRTAPVNPESQIGENNEIEFKTTTQFR